MQRPEEASACRNAGEEATVRLFQSHDPARTDTPVTADAGGRFHSAAVRHTGAAHGEHLPLPVSQADGQVYVTPGR